MWLIVFIRVLTILTLKGPEFLSIWTNARMQMNGYEFPYRLTMCYPNFTASEIGAMSMFMDLIYYGILLGMFFIFTRRIISCYRALTYANSLILLVTCVLTS